jgi:hypothetical protein
MENVFFMMAVFAGPFAVAIYFILTTWFAHRERMAKIQQGIDPGDKSRTSKATSELADRMLALEQEVVRLRAISDPLFQGDEKPLLSTDIKKPPTSK